MLMGPQYGTCFVLTPLVSRILIGYCIFGTFLHTYFDELYIHTSVHKITKKLYFLTRFVEFRALYPELKYILAF